MTVSHHPRSNRQAEHFLDMFKRAFKKSNKEVPDEVALQQFLRVYKVTPTGMSLDDMMFEREIKLVFDTLLLDKKGKFAMDISKLVKMLMLGQIKTENKADKMA